VIRNVLAALVLLVFAAPLRAQGAEADVEALLAADGAFAAAAARAHAIPDALAAMFDEGVVVPMPGRGLIAGRDAVLEAYRASASFREGNVSWAPVRGGISADGTQGFTFGFLDISAGPEDRRGRKYLAYWVRRAEGWRVAAYRLGFRGPGPAPAAAIRPPSLPGRAVPGSLAAHEASLAAAEQAFSDRAQSAGLREAFAAFGREDSVNMGGAGDFTHGAAAIAQSLGPEIPAPLRWSTERSIVAASGDLGVSIGTIRANRPAEGQPSTMPFFTVWRREGPGAPWRYIAE
jgi:ketosteroid isomerase-like protein